MSETSARKRVLLTGVSGRVGRAIVSDLSQTFDLRIFDKEDPGDLPGIVVGDISQPDGLREAMEGIETVIHLAAQSTEADFITKLVPNNIEGLYYMFENAKAAGVKRIIFPSTIQAFGAHPRGHTIQATDQPRPVSIYGATKAFGETLGRYYHDHHGIEFLAVRIGWYLNPEDPKDLEHLKRHGARSGIWLSGRDAVQMFTKAVEAPTIGEDGYGIVHATSRPVFERMSLQPARDLLGYEPVDNAAEFLETEN